VNQSLANGVKPSDVLRATIVLADEVIEQASHVAAGAQVWKWH
jgi:hypothetical protein